MADQPFIKLRLPGGFVIADLAFSHEPMVDALGREAIAQTRIVGREFRLLIRGGLSEAEMSITLYHEILEAASVASPNPPASVTEFNEANFEEAAQASHNRWGKASPANLDRLLQF
jgi:hypothetical protein